MNGRIRELALQAGLITEQDDRENWQEYINDVSEFAELLIRECVTKMALEIMDEQWVDDAVKNTYIHFGVEE